MRLATESIHNERIQTIAGYHSICVTGIDLASVVEALSTCDVTSCGCFLLCIRLFHALSVFASSPHWLLILDQH